MSELVHDRYIRLDGERGLDLVTGVVVSLAALPAGLPLDRDSNSGTGGTSGTRDAIVEALEHGQDGCPRSFAADAEPETPLATVIERAVRAAVRRGFVAVSAGLYFHFRQLFEDHLRTRTLFIVRRPGIDHAHAHPALLDAAARSPRPHVLFRAGPRLGPRRHNAVREARPAYASGRAVPPHVETKEVAALRARADRACAAVGAGRHAAAERVLRDVVGALARRDACAAAARAAISLGCLLGERGRTAAALLMLDEASQLAQRSGDPNLGVEARLWQASVRLVDGSPVAAEAICRAVLAGGTDVEATLCQWASALLAESLLYQGRSPDGAAIAADDVVASLPIVTATVYDISVRVALATGLPFEAGRHVASLKALAASTGDPRIQVLAGAADLAVLAATGDLLRGKEALELALAAARSARTPLRAAWARVVWVDALRRAGRSADAVAQVASLQRVARVAPKLLQREIARRLAPENGSEPSAPRLPASRPCSLSVALVRLAHVEDDDKSAVTLLVERIASELGTSRIDVVSSDAGPVTLICSVGNGLATTIGARIVDTAITIGPERHAGGWEIGVPLCRGHRAIGALVCRWPIDRSNPLDAIEVLELSAAVVSPRFDAWIGRARLDAGAAAAVPELIGVSASIGEVRKAIARAATSPFSVLIEGESGVGKELAARAVHQLSPRRERRFCDINCAALPEELLESELFGHVRGAFSGAVVDRAGLFEDADGGTLFLDEVAELSPRAQAKLLRALQQQEVRRVGESFARKIDTRIVAAANRDMRSEAASGRFRSDLLYRLDVIRIRMPPLRERPEDIPVLASHYWRIAADRVGSRAELSPGVLAALSRYHWPGNVRELQNVVASLAVGAPSRGRVPLVQLPSILSASAAAPSTNLAEARLLFERNFVRAALAQAGDNRGRAARALGLTRQGLSKTLNRLGLEGGAQSPIGHGSQLGGRSDEGERPR